MIRSRIRIIINIVIAVTVFGAWLSMFFAGGGRLSSAGIASLRYFTVLSNLLAAFAASAWLIGQFRGQAGRRTEVFKYVAAVGVALTFAVVAFFLGPLYGMLSMYRGANLWLHLIVPVICMLEQILFCEEKMTAGDNRLAAVPVLVYGCAYLANIIINGKGEWPDTNDWYGFVNWGLPVGLVIFAGIALAAWGLGLLLRKCWIGGRRQA